MSCWKMSLKFFNFDEFWLSVTSYLGPMDATNIAANFVANKAEVIIRVRGLPFSAKPSEVVSTSNFCCTFLHICSALLAIDWTLEHLAMVYWLIKHFKVQLLDHRNNKMCMLLCRLWKFGHAHHSCGLITYKYVVSHLNVQQSISMTPDITSLLGQMTGWHYLLNKSLQPIIILLVWSNWRFQQIEVSGVYCKLKETFR